MLWIFFALAPIALYFAALYWIGRWSVRPPRVPLFLTPALLEAPQETLDIPGPLGRLRAWWMEAPGSKTVVVLCHGYLVNRAEPLPIAYFLWKRGCSCLLFDFRAHGASAGARTTLGWDEREDVKAAVAYARKRVPGARIVLYGTSMGAAAACFALADDPGLADALILDSVYSRLRDAVRGWWVFFGGRRLALALGPLLWMDRLVLGLSARRVDVAEALRRIRGVPILILQGERDDVVPPEAVQRNLEAGGPDVRTIWFADCNHSEARYHRAEEFRRAILEFLEEHRLLEAVPAAAGEP